MTKSVLTVVRVPDYALSDKSKPYSLGHVETLLPAYGSKINKFATIEEAKAFAKSKGHQVVDIEE